MAQGVFSGGRQSADKEIRAAEKGQIKKAFVVNTRVAISKLPQVVLAVQDY